MTTPSSITQPLIEVRGLTCERGERTLFTGMSFTVAPGSLVRIAGSNGAGKTTLLRLLTGLMRPAEGEIFWRGEPILKAAQDFWRELCYIGHRNGVKDDLSVMENVLINARIASLSCTPEAARAALAAVGLSDYEDVPAGQLSQGQRRRVALARLWLSESVPLWILDEPFTALDVKGVARLADLVSKHVAEGGVVMLVTHQEVPVDPKHLFVIEPERWAPKRRSAAGTCGGGEGDGASCRSRKRCQGLKRGDAKMFNLFMTILKRDLTLSLRRKSDLAQVIFFFAVVVTLVPLGVGAETNILRSIAPGVVWVAALLAALLSLPRMFATDHEDGTLEQMLVAAEPVPVIVVAKVAAHWIVTGVPMTIFATIFGVMFDLELDVTLVMVASLLIGTPVLSLVGAVGAALTLGLRAGGVLTSLLVLPLYIPVLIFGSGAATAAAMSLSPASHFMIVGGLSLFALALAPFAVAAALRIAEQ